MKKPFSSSLLLALLLSVAACNQTPDAAPVSLDPPAGAACSLDGMLLADYPGPKGQIIYADGKSDFFCDTMEVLSMILAPEQVRSIKGVYVQDMAQADWQKPQGHWIDAKQAFYVSGSKLQGSMGPTFASFAQHVDAEKFAATNGGTVHAFTDITLAMVRLDGGVMHDQKM